ncbi:MAG: ParB/RepB/Spo0J family partition protein [Qingshengfaniella sp.]
MARRRLTPARPGVAPNPTAKDSPDPQRFARETAQPGPLPPIARVAGDSADKAALQRMVEGMEEARASGRMIIDVPLADVAPGYLLRDRVQIDAEEIAALKASIRAHGQRVPAEITPAPQDGEDPRPWGLISGWRRLRALSELHAETEDPRFATLRALVRPPEGAADSYVAMVEENELRVGISYYERARLVHETAALGVFADVPAALSGLFATASRAKRSKIGSFIEIHQALGHDLRFPAEIPERLGLAVVARLRAEGPNMFRTALTREKPETAAAEIAVLTRLVAATPRPVSRAKHVADQEQLTSDLAWAVKRRKGDLVLTLSGKGANEALVDRLRRILCDPPD